MSRRPPRSTLTDTLVPYTTLFRSLCGNGDPVRVTLEPGGSVTKSANFPATFKRWESGRVAQFTVCSPTVGRPLPPGAYRVRVTRSEEHTSELQSLMRISYAVFCLKKKINTHI